MTFAEQYAAMSNDNLNGARRIVLRGLETTEDMSQWAQLAGRLDAINAEMDKRESRAKPYSSDHRPWSA